MLTITSSSLSDILSQLTWVGDVTFQATPRDPKFKANKQEILLEPSLHFNPGMQSSVCILPSVCIFLPVCSLHFSLTSCIEDATATLIHLHFFPSDFMWRGFIEISLKQAVLRLKLE